MTTHRSLNKLEFKAHMSIHNKVEVSDGLTKDANHTRDRFGKDHRVSETEIRPRPRRLKKTALLLLMPFLAGTFAHARPNTDVQIESEPMDHRVDPKVEPPEERFAFYRDNDKSLEINEDGDPNMNVRF